MTSLHFVCADLFLYIVGRSKGGAGLHLCDVEAEKCQCVDFVPSTLLRGGLNCFRFFLSAKET